jgi:hypothetical protein
MDVPGMRLVPSLAVLVLKDCLLQLSQQFIGQYVWLKQCYGGGNVGHVELNVLGRVIRLWRVVISWANHCEEIGHSSTSHKQKLSIRFWYQLCLWMNIGAIGFLSGLPPLKWQYSEDYSVFGQSFCQDWFPVDQAYCMVLGLIHRKKAIYRD